MLGIVYALPAVALCLTSSTWVKIGEKKGYYRIIFATMCLTAVFTILLGMPIVRNLYVFSLFYFVTGVFCAAISPCTSALICKRIATTFQGRAHSMNYSSGTLGSLIMITLSGIIGTRFGIGAVFVFTGIVIFSGFLILKQITKDGENQY